MKCSSSTHVRFRLWEWSPNKFITYYAVGENICLYIFLYLVLPRNLKYKACLKGNTIVSARSEKLCLLERGSSKVTTLILSLSPRKSKKGFKEHKTELISRVNSYSKVLFAWECYQKTRICDDLYPFS